MLDMTRTARSHIAPPDAGAAPSGSSVSRGLGHTIARFSFAVFFAFFASHADIYYGRIGSLPIPPTILFVSAAVPFVLGVFVWNTLLRRQWSELLYIRSNASTIVPFAVLVVLSLIQAGRIQAGWDAGILGILLTTYALFVFLVALLAMQVPALSHGWRTYLFLTMVLLLITVGYDLYEPGAYGRYETRPAGLPVDANTTAFILVMLTSLLCRYDRGRLQDALILGLCLVGVLATLSRGGLALFGLLLAMYAVLMIKNGGLRTFMRAASRIAAIAAAGGVVVVLYSSQIANLDMGWMSMGELLNKRLTISAFETSGGRDASVSNRIDHLYEGMRQISAAPVLGYGTAYTQSFKKSDLGELTHNMYIDIWLNLGIFGLISYLWLLLGGVHMFWRRSFMPGVVFVALVFAQGMFSHTVLDDRAFLLMYGMICAISLQRTGTPLKRRQSPGLHISRWDQVSTRKQAAMAATGAMRRSAYKNATRAPLATGMDA